MSDKVKDEAVLTREECVQRIQNLKNNLENTRQLYWKIQGALDIYIGFEKEMNGESVETGIVPPPADIPKDEDGGTEIKAD
jgi:hypothetical protein